MPRNTGESDDGRRLIGYSFDLREERVEILAFGAFVFSQPGLHQATETKSVMVHAHDAATVRTLLVLVRGRCKRISKAGKIHFSCPSRLLVAEGAPFVYYFKAIRRPEAVSLVMINCVP